MTDPMRSDAAAVYRVLRDSGSMTMVDLALASFPGQFGSADPAFRAIRRVAVRRTLEAVVWMRARGVVIEVTPGAREMFDLLPADDDATPRDVVADLHGLSVVTLRGTAQSAQSPGDQATRSEVT